MAGIEQRIPPQNNDAERAVLGAMLMERDAITRATNFLQPEDLYQRKHQLIYQAILNIYSRNEAVDLITVPVELTKMAQLDEVGGAPYLAELLVGVVTTANIEDHARIVQENANRRKALLLARKLLDSMFDPNADLGGTLSETQQALVNVSTGSVSKGYVRLSDALLNAYSQIEMLGHSKGKTTGVPTGLKDLDLLTSGWQPSDLIIVAARPSVGKTAFTMNLARNAAKHGAKVVFFSLEMGADQLAMRLLAMESAVDATKLRNGQLDDSDWERLIAGLDALSELNIFIVDVPNLPFNDVRAISRQVKAEHGCDMIIIDYLQLMSGSGRKGDNRQQEISDISRGCKQLARELKVPVIALSQLSRSVEQRQDKRPMLSDLRDSGAIEQDADIVSFLYREDYYDKGENVETKNVVEVIVAKHRNGPVDTVKLYFVKDIQKFFDLDTRRAS